MIFGTLGRYFLKRYLITLGWFFLGVMGIVYLIDFSETARRLSDLPAYTVPVGLLITLVRLPLIIQQTVPFIALFVGMTTLISLNRRTELVIARAAGMSVWQFMMPFLIGAVALGLFTMLVLNPIAAWGQRKVESLEANLHGEVSRKTTLSVPWLRQDDGKSAIIIGAKSVLDDGSTLVNPVFIHFDPQGNIVLRQDAAKASLESGYWVLNNVTERRPGEIPAHHASVEVPTNLKRDFVSERLMQPESVAFYDLFKRIKIARSFGISTKALETQFHFLLSQPFLMVAMTLIAATVSLKFSRFNQSRSVILGGIVSGFVLYVVTVLVKAFGSSGVVPPFVATWVPVVVAMALGATLLLHQEDG